ncbi:MAG: PH domain-containing protein [Blautia sp.]|nr:PH domain-containing protein [Blautia sp.]
MAAQQKKDDRNKTQQAQKAPETNNGKRPAGRKAEVVWKDRKHHLWFPISFTKYCLTDDDRLHIDRGLLSTVSDQTMLYRITDMQLRRTLGQRLFGTGTLVLVSKVDADHEIVLQNIGHPKDTESMFADKIEESRRKYNVVGKEFYSRGCGVDHFGDSDFDDGDDVDD